MPDPVAAIVGTVSTISAKLSSDKATDAQVQSGQNQIALKRDIYNQNSQNFKPFLKSGQNALAALNFESGIGDRPEGYQGYEASPDYQFQLAEGMKALDASAASRGKLFSGATGKAAMKFGQGIAAQGRQSYLNRLSGIANAGQASAGQQAAAGQSYVTGAANAMSGIGDARAAGAIAEGNAFSSGINNAIGLYQYQNQLNTPIFGGSSWS